MKCALLVLASAVALCASPDPALAGDSSPDATGKPAEVRTELPPSLSPTPTAAQRIKLESIHAAIPAPAAAFALGDAKAPPVATSRPPGPDRPTENSQAEKQSGALLRMQQRNRATMLGLPAGAAPAGDVRTRPGPLVTSRPLDPKLGAERAAAITEKRAHARSAPSSASENRLAAGAILNPAPTPLAPAQLEKQAELRRIAKGGSR